MIIRRILSLPNLTFNLLFAGAIIVACAIQPSPEKTVRDYEKASNAHDIDAVMRLVSDEIKFVIEPIIYISGEIEMRGIAEYDSALNSTLAISNLLIKGDTVYCAMTEDNQWHREAGIGPAYYPEAMFIISGGRIAYMKAEFADSSIQKIENITNAFFPWLKASYPSNAAELLPHGKFVYNRANAVTFLEMLREWREAVKSEDTD